MTNIRRMMIGGSLLSLVGVLTDPVESMPTKPKESKFTIPPGITKLVVKSHDAKGNMLINYTLNVQPGQVFTIVPE